MLKTTLAVLIAYTALSTTAFAQKEADTRLTAEQVHTDIELAKEAYTRIHPGYARYTPQAEIDAAWDDISNKARIDNGMSAGEMYLAVQKVLTLIRCDHTKAELPKALKLERNTTPVYLPMRWQLIEGRAIITLTPEGSALSVGDEITAINGRHINDLINEVEAYIPYQGKAEWARAGGVGESLEFMGGAIDHFGALLWDVGRTAKLDIQSHDNQSRSVIVERVNYDDWVAIGNQKPSVRNFKDAVTYKNIGTKSGYLKIDTFVNYRDRVAPDEIYRPVFKDIQESGVEYLVLDLRENGGGSNDARLRLTAHLVDKPITPKRDLRVSTLDLAGLKGYLSTWEKSALNPDPENFTANADSTYSLKPALDEDLRPVSPAQYAFNGTLIILTSASNSSGSTSFSALMKSHRNAVLIGEKTGGTSEGTTAGVLFTFTMPESQIRSKLPVFRSYNNVSGFEPGRGLSPDIEAPMTVKAFRADEDPAMIAALAYIKDKTQ